MQYYTTLETMEKLNIKTIATLRRWVDRGFLHPMTSTIDHRVRLYDQTEVDRLVNADKRVVDPQEITAPTPAPALPTVNVALVPVGNGHKRELVVPCCPYCQQVHVHGPGQGRRWMPEGPYNFGHRNTKCAPEYRPNTGYVLVWDGITVDDPRTQVA